MSTKRFRIAISFAGEKRDFVEEIASILAKRFGEAAILYDKFHKAEFARDDLAAHLTNLYRDQSELIVAILCPDYDKKEWCGLEWKIIRGLLKQRKADEIMLTRFGLIEPEALEGLAGYLDLDHESPESAATVILERLALNEGKPKNHYLKPNATSAPLASAIPNNLPRLQSFFGRTEELRQIAEALDPESRTWGTLIDGAGGMGKTSLAMRAAYDCHPGQFERIIFVSVKDREMDDDGERTLGNFLVPGFLEMLNEIARELGQVDFAKAAQEQRIRLLLDSLRHAQVLLILDNLESLTKSDRDQLFNFVKRLPQGCKAILTSRRRIGSGSDLLILEKLDEAAALETLADIAGHNRLLAKTSEAERLTLWKQTGGNPLLLRWVAGQIGRGSCRTFTDALHFLRSCPKDNDPLEFIFGDLANEFTAPETRVLCALTYFTLPALVKHITSLTTPLSEGERELGRVAFDTPGEASTAEFQIELEVQQNGLSEAKVETALNSLANRSLVVPDQEEKQYALVPMVADFLQKHRPDVVRQTGEQLEARAYALIVENGYQEHDRFPVLDAAWPTVAPALPLFLAGSNSRLQTVCRALNEFLNFTGRWDESLSLNQQAETRAVVAGDNHKAGWRAFRVGTIQTLRQQAEEVLNCADRAAAHWRAAKAGSRERAIAIQLRGRGHRLRQDYHAAITAFQEVLDLDRSVSVESVDVAIHLNDLASAEQRSGDFVGAERHYNEALRVALAVGYAEGVPSITGNLASLALTREDWLAAELLAREALTLAEKLGRQELIASNCERLAKALVRQDRAIEGLSYANRAVEIFTRLGSPRLSSAQAKLTECEESIPR